MVMALQMKQDKGVIFPVLTSKAVHTLRESFEVLGFHSSVVTCNTIGLCKGSPINHGFQVAGWFWWLHLGVEI